MWRQQLHRYVQQFHRYFEIEMLLLLWLLVAAVVVASLLMVPISICCTFVFGCWTGWWFLRCCIAGRGATIAVCEIVLVELDVVLSIICFLLIGFLFCVASHAFLVILFYSIYGMLSAYD